jgi:hypothetical protein
MPALAAVLISALSLPDGKVWGGNDKGLSKADDLRYEILQAVPEFERQQQ